MPRFGRGGPRGTVGDVLGDVLAVVGSFLLLGAVCGVVWWAVVDPATYTAMRDGGGAMSEVQLGKRFDADGWYAVTAIVSGFVAGLGLTWWRSRDFRLTTALLVPGAALAAGVMAVVGRALGPGSPQVALVQAHPGQSVPVQLGVTGFAVYLLWPVAVLFGALMVLWSSPRPSAAHTVTPAEGTGVTGPSDRPEHTGPRTP